MGTCKYIRYSPKKWFVIRATYDFTWDKYVNRIAAAIYEQGGIAAAVSHGPAAHLNATLSNDTFKPL
jgi:hypothetical protein